MKKYMSVGLIALFFMLLSSPVSVAQLHINGGSSYLMNQAKDVSTDFGDFTNIFFFADKLSNFDPVSASGKIEWKRNTLYTRQAFNTNAVLPQNLRMLDFPETAYDNNPQLKFSVEFVTPRTLRIRMLTTPVEQKEAESVMLVKTPGKDNSWKYSAVKGGHLYKSIYGSILIEENPWRIILKDAAGKQLTDTWRWKDNDSTQVKNLPFNFIKRGSDNSRSINPVFTLSPGEKIVGCGESFTSLNKVGQKVNLFVTDPQGPETDQMYKPIPFFMSNRGYGMFMHTSAPVTCDFGATYTGINKLFMADEALDLFVFFGEPKDILDEYTSLTGKSPMPPLWSFGTWMSRITYFSEAEGYDVAKNLRKYKIPADVIHFDTGWFETDWQCDYQFAPSRFSNPEKMIKDLREDGFHISLWQLTYFTPKNKYFSEIVDKGMNVKNANGGMPYEDAVLDFSNPQTVAWYQDKLAGLLKMGVGAIKVDFGEAAPLNGFYASGKGGLYEHNLYPLRYNKTVADVTSKVNNEHIIWARSAWAGSQRYPIHWGGDAANTDIGMQGTLRGGLSLGLSGFSFWSHDIGGFVQKSPEELYRRWLPFGFLTSHSRAHGAPPKEPWLYNESFTKAFRESAEMKYILMPYVYAQAKNCTEKGLPMVRALFVEFPDDPGAWLVEDQYMFGNDIMVAPLMENGSQRNVYLPSGKWIDYQSGKIYQSGWNKISVGHIPAVILVRDGSVIPHIALAQSTDKMDWSKLELSVYSSDAKQAKGLLCIPADNLLKEVILTNEGSKWLVKDNPYQGKIKLTVNSIIK
ncbi:alpha-D-xyloside xylohydrolase [Bacteroides luti]|uniref:Alpha-D-xyloside xylohydrolase n=1 Tax=Bacteroides luti TaxID=1297750 RepID=A0A1M4WUF1_9BACE|nr:alpha-D-xyloside xylohydrolase [Bacteroides luti]